MHLVPPPVSLHACQDTCVHNAQEQHTLLRLDHWRARNCARSCSSSRFQSPHILLTETAITRTPCSSMTERTHCEALASAFTAKREQPQKRMRQRVRLRRL